MNNEDILCQNLPFFRRMRNFYYEKAWKLFQELEIAVKNAIPETSARLIDQIDRYSEALEIANEYARNAIRGNTRKKLKSFREDQSLGIMEEEVVFVGFLEELLSSGAYVRDRIDTNSNVRRYMEAIKGREYGGTDKKGFISNIVTSIEADQKTDKEEILQIIKFIRARFRTANNIFSVLERRDTGGNE